MTMSDPKSQIVGVWKLVSVMYEDQETKTQTPVLGDNPKRLPDRDAGRPLAGARHTVAYARCQRPTRSAPRRLSG